MAASTRVITNQSVEAYLKKRGVPEAAWPAMKASEHIKKLAEAEHD